MHIQITPAQPCPRSCNVGGCQYNAVKQIDIKGTVVALCPTHLAHLTVALALEGYRMASIVEAWRIAQNVTLQESALDKLEPAPTLGAHKETQ